MARRRDAALDQDSASETVNLPDAADSDAETVYQDRTGDLWVAAVNLFRVHDGKAAPYRFPGISGVRVRNVFRDNEGAFWIGTEGRGAYRQIGNSFTHYSTEEGLVNNFVRGFLQGRDGSVWIATDEGVSRWRAARDITNYQMRDGLAYFSTRSLLEDRRWRHLDWNRPRSKPAAWRQLVRNRRRDGSAEK